MGVFYLIPAVLAWLLYGLSVYLSAPWWVDYPLFGLACIATALGALIAGLVDSVGPRF